MRGNGGGDSTWGDKILTSLFGSEYVEQQLTALNQGVYVEWRVSQDNLKHVEHLLETHPFLKKTYEGMKQALEEGKEYYSDPEVSDVPTGAENLFHGKVIVLIDGGCGSACLDFLDGLRAMKSGVVFVGEPTGVDTVYMDLRKVSLPSGKGQMALPIKEYKNRPRGNNVPHLPDIEYKFGRGGI